MSSPSVSLLTDANILQDPLDTKLFPGVSSSVKVHDGFRNAHALTATKILTEVKRLMALKGSTKVITVCIHSIAISSILPLRVLFIRSATLSAVLWLSWMLCYSLSTCRQVRAYKVSLMDYRVSSILSFIGALNLKDARGWECGICGAY